MSTYKNNETQKKLFVGFQNRIMCERMFATLNPVPEQIKCNKMFRAWVVENMKYNFGNPHRT